MKATLTNVQPAVALQFESPNDPEKLALLDALQPSLLCRAYWFAVIELMASTMSISPPAGHVSPLVQ